MTYDDAARHYKAFNKMIGLPNQIVVVLPFYYILESLKYTNKYYGAEGSMYEHEGEPHRLGGFYTNHSKMKERDFYARMAPPGNENSLVYYNYSYQDITPTMETISIVETLLSTKNKIPSKISKFSEKFLYNFEENYEHQRG